MYTVFSSRFPHPRVSCASLDSSGLSQAAEVEEVSVLELVDGKEAGVKPAAGDTEGKDVRDMDTTACWFCEEMYFLLLDVY